MSNYAPKTESEIREIEESLLLPNGNYGFEIVKAEERKSKSSDNYMFALSLKVFNEDGDAKFVDDYIVFTDRWAFKLRHLAASVGLVAEYEAGTLKDHDLVGKTGVAKIIIQKDKDPEAQSKNAVRDYIVIDKTEVPASTIAQSEEALSDKIPF